MQVPRHETNDRYGVRGVPREELESRRRDLGISKGLSPVGSEAGILAGKHIQAIDAELDRRSYYDPALGD